jgi:hypothetical protein
LIDDLDCQIDDCARELQRLGVDHPYIRLLETVPGIGWVLGYTIASEIGDIHRFSSAKKLVGYTGLCPRAYQSGQQDRRGALAKNGPRYLRWALIEAAMHASRNARYTERYQRTARRLGAQRGRKAARVELARDLRPRSGTCSPATRSSPRQVPLSLWSHDDPSLNWTAGANAPISLIQPRAGDREMSDAPTPTSHSS